MQNDSQPLSANGGVPAQSSQIMGTNNDRVEKQNPCSFMPSSSEPQKSIESQPIHDNNKEMEVDVDPLNHNIEASVPANLGNLPSNNFRSNDLGSHPNPSEESKNISIINKENNQEPEVRVTPLDEPEKSQKQKEESKAKPQSRYRRVSVSKWRCRDAEEYNMFE